MGATRLASGKCHVHTLNKGSQTVLITRLSVSLCRHFRRGTRLLKKPTRDASPPLELAFSGSVGGHLVLEETQALMGATRLASGKCHVHTLNKGSQTVLITRLSGEPLLSFPTRDASPPLELAFSASVGGLSFVLESVRCLRFTRNKYTMTRLTRQPIR